jgi:glutathione S-transferase
LSEVLQENGGDKGDGQEKQTGHFGGLRTIREPPNLAAWRERLFHLNEPISMTEEEYGTTSSR